MLRSLGGYTPAVKTPLWGGSATILPVPPRHILDSSYSTRQQDSSKRKHKPHWRRPSGSSFQQTARLSLATGKQSFAHASQGLHTSCRHSYHPPFPIWRQTGPLHHCLGLDYLRQVDLKHWQTGLCHSIPIHSSFTLFYLVPFHHESLLLQQLWSIREADSSPSVSLFPHRRKRENAFSIFVVSTNTSDFAWLH